MSNVLFVFNFGVATACFPSSKSLIFFFQSCFLTTYAVVNTFLPYRNKSLHDDSITQFDVIRISQQLAPTRERSSVEMMVIMPALHTVRTPR